MTRKSAVPGWSVALRFAPRHGIDDVRKVFSPFLLYIQGQGVGQKLLEVFWRLTRRMSECQPVLFRNREVPAESLQLVHLLPAQAGRSFEQMIEDKDGPCLANQEYACCRRYRLREYEEAKRLCREKRKCEKGNENGAETFENF